jgi:hypothetical protein
MTYRTRILLLMAFATLCFSSAQAVTVTGARSCGDWLKYKPVSNDKEWPRVVAEAWVVGYLSGIATGTDKDALKGTTASSLFVWMDNHCQTNPLDDISDGAINLYFELVKRKGL